MEENNKSTVYQRLNNLFYGGVVNTNKALANKQSSDDDVIIRTKNKDEFEAAKLQARQQSLLARQWRKAGDDIKSKSLANLSVIKMMYRDADLMDDFPEIGAALDITMEEATHVNNKGFMLNISSKSERIKKILQDLFYNRLQININLPMIVRGMIKYGNEFMLLNLNSDNGIVGWKKLPVYEMERYEGGMTQSFMSPYASMATIDPDDPIETQFIWMGQNEYIPYKQWQVVHFRMLYDSRFLPYGCSFLQKARRHFRMLSIMEDLLLVYRMERSWERRVYKIYVGGIDPEDVPALVDDVANEFKRTPIFDPETGQIDLRKNIAAPSEDYFIPVREPGESSPIETLQGSQNLTAMDDIEFLQNKVLTALRVPASFIGFKDSAGDGKNLSLLDIRFTKTVNRIQQYVLLELNKVAIIHLKMLGFDEDLTNFTLSMNNPSSQAQMLEIDNLSKKIGAARDAVNDIGNGLRIMSLVRAQKEILGWSDKEIKDNLEELRLEAALSNELKATGDIIKRTHLFDNVDNIYGEAGAEYSQGGDEGNEEGGMDLVGGGLGGALDFGDDDMGGIGGDMEFEDVMGDEGVEVGSEPADIGQETLAESVLSSLERKNKAEKKALVKKLEEEKSIDYIKLIGEHIDKISTEDKEDEYTIDDIPLMNKNIFINEEMTHLCNELDNRAFNEDNLNKPITLNEVKK